MRYTKEELLLIKEVIDNLFLLLSIFLFELVILFLKVYFCSPAAYMQIIISQAVETTPDAILKIKHDIDAELFGEDQSWGRLESNVSVFSVFYLCCLLSQA